MRLEIESPRIATTCEDVLDFFGDGFLLPFEDVELGPDVFFEMHACTDGDELVEVVVEDSTSSAKTANEFATLTDYTSMSKIGQGVTKL